MVGSDMDAGQEAELAPRLAAFWKQAAPKGTCKRSELDMVLPDGDAEGVISRDEFIVWLFKKPLGSPALLTAALKARVCSLLALAEKAPPLSIWPQGAEPSSEPSDDLWESIEARFAAIRSAPACAAEHFEQVVGAGINANSVVFPRMAPPPSWGRVHWGRVVAPGPATQPDKLPFPLPHGCMGAPHTGPPPDESAWAPGAEAAAGEEWLLGRAVDINQLRQFSFYMAQMDMELTEWTVLEQGVIAEDKLMVAQEQAAQFLELRGPPSEKALRQRRRRLEQRFGPLNVRCGEELMPLLEREASFEEMHARWARDRAQEAAEHDARAERGAAFTAWLSEGKWPPVDKAWQQHAKWFAAWRERSVPTAKPSGLRRMDSTSSDKSWLSVSDISWIDVGSQASERGWEVVVQEADPELVQATEALRSLPKADIIKVKALANPPPSVVLTLEAICALLEVEPSWAASVKLLADNAFVDRLVNLRCSVKQKALEAVSPYVASEDFTPDTVAKEGNSVCACLCRWVRAVYKYHTLSHAAGKATCEELAQRPKEQLLSEAAAALTGISKAELVELKCLSRPPQGVADVCFCLLELLAGVFGKVEVSRNGIPKVSWKAVKVAMGNLDELLTFLKSFKDLVDEGAVPRKSIERALTRRDDMGVEFSPEAMRKRSLAAAGICTWVAHMLVYCELVVPPKAAPPEAAPEADAPCDDGTAVAICKADIQELKSLAKPPECVVPVVVACVMLLQDEACDWKGAQAALSDPTFLKRIAGFDPKVLSKKRLDEVEALLGESNYDFEGTRRASSAAAALAKWVEATVEAGRAAGG